MTIMAAPSRKALIQSCFIGRDPALCSLFPVASRLHGDHNYFTDRQPFLLTMSVDFADRSLLGFFAKKLTDPNAHAYDDDHGKTNSSDHARSCTMKPNLLLLSLIALLRLAGAEARAQAPPSDWTDPSTGHRVLRLSGIDGGSNLYFHQNVFTPKGDKVIFNTKAGIPRPSI